jgi:hypothetical protein
LHQGGFPKKQLYKMILFGAYVDKTVFLKKEDNLA